MSPQTTPGDPSAGRSPRRALRLALRAVAAALVLVVVILAVAAAAFRWHLGRSLPVLDGEVAVAGLSASVTVERDALGVPTIRGSNRLDVARGLGFLHGQERFFQMDLIRRQAAGELAELVGEAALPIDRRHRLHRFRARARAAVDSLAGFERQLIEAYVAGVNTGLEALGAPPFEYTVLRTRPAPWRPEDCLLAVYTMYLDLQGNGGPRELSYGVAHDLLPPALLAFLAPRGTEWDAPVDGGLFEEPPMPTPAELDLESWPEDEPKAAHLARPAPEPPIDFAVGSNNWAVAGTHTAHGGALLADDMHLGLNVPNIWYRASFVFPDPEAPGGERRVIGVTLPGAMLVVVGSNGEVAWGFTNSNGDWVDLVVVEPAPGDPDAYLTPDGPRRFERHQEELRAKGGTTETLEIVETIWGPIWDTDHQGRQLALRWVAHDPRAANLTMAELESVSSVDEAVEVAARIGSPAQNFVTADANGRIAWTLMGPIPRRFGHEGRFPSSWADGSRGWDGWLDPAEHPRVVDPESGRLWTANARVVSGEMYDLLGDGGYDLGARAGQIRDGLLALDSAGEQDLLAIQLDDRALFLERWKNLLLEVLGPEAVATDPRRQELRRLVETWSGRASVDSNAYRLVRAFRFQLYEQVFSHLTAPAAAADDRFRFWRLDQEESALWRLARDRPQHLLDPRFSDWQEQLLAAVDGVLDDLLQDGGELASKTWGEHNRVTVQHPLSRFIPGAGRWLDMPATPLPGDSNMPRVQTVRHGASERLVVSPGREEQGLFHMPTGQSGHPLSPAYRNGHAAWMEGSPTRFLPGTTEHTLTLSPAGGSGEPPAATPPVSDGDVETTSLLGQPLPRPSLPADFRDQQEGLLESALADLAERPEDPDAVIWVGRRTAYLGRYREAVDIYSRGIADHPDHPALYRHRGHRHITLRQLDSAISDLERAALLIAGTPDEVEPDGLPNLRGIPTSTSHSNIWYHLGLAHYLCGDFEKALEAYRNCLSYSTNPDMLVATSHWLYMTHRRLGDAAAAERVLSPIQPNMDIIENHDYHRLLLMYKGLEDPETLLSEAEQAGNVSFASVAYGVGNWHLVRGDPMRAEEIFRRIVATDTWAAFGYLAAEAELARAQTSTPAAA